MLFKVLNVITVIKLTSNSPFPETNIIGDEGYAMFVVGLRITVGGVLIIKRKLNLKFSKRYQKNSQVQYTILVVLRIQIQLKYLIFITSY